MEFVLSLEMHPFIHFLEQRLLHPLPGQSAQKHMAPSPVNGAINRLYEPPEHACKSGVLVPFVTHPELGLQLILTLRVSHIKHGGQISFPGGRQEAGETSIETALRESSEEIGISEESVQVLGCMSSLYINKSNSLVTPVVAALKQVPVLKPDPNEVEEAFFINFEDLLKEEYKQVEQWELHAYTYKVPFWNIHRVPLWGATAMMLSELVELYKEFSESGKQLL